MCGSKCSTYELAVSEGPGYLQFRARGERNAETVLEMMKDIMDSCAERQVFTVLVDARKMTGKLSIGEAIKLIPRLVPLLMLPSSINKSAIVEAEELKGTFTPTSGEAMKRGFNIRMFTDIDEAIDCLREGMN